MNFMVMYKWTLCPEIREDAYWAIVMKNFVWTAVMMHIVGQLKQDLVCDCEGMHLPATCTWDRRT